MQQAVETIVGEQLDIRSLLESSAHIGHPTKRWHPNMRPYIYAKRGGVHIINPERTIACLERASRFLGDVAARGGNVLLVGTKKQAQDTIADEARRCEAHFINRRWLGGLLTNFQTIQERVDYLVRMEERKVKGEALGHTKREEQRAETEISRLNNYLGGIKNMTKLPDVVFVVDIVKEKNAILEARRLKIPIVAIVDTNSDPTLVDYPIPSNDDSVRAIKLIARRIADAVIEGRARFQRAEEERLAEVAEIEKQEAEARATAQAAAAARLARGRTAEPGRPEAEATKPESVTETTAEELKNQA
ncbi:MAG: 30S ribosomal protein S2 [Chloroflexi bacterium]|nr:30S ribosomal protein S2 [Chloroflexota bacterium]